MPKPPIYQILIVIEIVLGLAAAFPVRAEKSDREKPLNIEADRMTADDNKKVTHFEGRVVLDQGTIHMTADQMTVHEDRDGMKYASAYGNPVTFKQKREGVDEWVEGQALHVEYNGQQERVELFDHAVVRRDKDEIKGDYLSYDTRTELLQAHGAPGTDSGNRLNADSNDRRTGRVHVVLQPHDDHPSIDTKTPPQGPPGLKLQSSPDSTP